MSWLDVVLLAACEKTGCQSGTKLYQMGLAGSITLKLKRWSMPLTRMDHVSDLHVFTMVVWQGVLHCQLFCCWFTVNRVTEPVLPPVRPCATIIPWCLPALFPVINFRCTVSSIYAQCCSTVCPCIMSAYFDVPWHSQRKLLCCRSAEV